MSGVRRAGAAVLAALGLALVPAAIRGQISLHGRAEIGRLEHRVRAGGLVETASGMTFGGALGVVGERFEVWGEASGGRLVAGSSDGDDHHVAEVRLLGGAKLSPWLTLQGGAGVRSFFTSVARQRWTTLRLGAEANVPLAPAGARAVARVHWMPVVSITGLPRPGIALAAEAGMEWHGARVGLSALYALERYDFPVVAGTRRLEELSSLQLRGTVRLRARGPKASPAHASR